MRALFFRHWEDLVAWGLAVGLGVLYISPILPNILDLGLHWPIASSHDEGVSLSVYGKWLVFAPHQYLTDAYSGDLATFYQYLSDTLCNALAALTGLPTLTVQSTLYAPLLGFLLFILSYLTLVPVVRDKKVSLMSSTLICLGTNSHILLPFDAAKDLQLTQVLHVPAMTQHLATSQAFGNVLFVPALALTFIAHRQFTPLRAVGTGVCLGLLFNAHTLTFLHVALAQIAYYSAVIGFESPWTRRKGIWIGWLLLLVAVFIWWIQTHDRFPFLLLALLGALVLAGDFAFERDRRFYIWTYATFGVLALPYLMALTRDSGGLKLDMIVGTSVTLLDVACFFGVYFFAAAIAFTRCRDRRVLLWLGATIAITFLLGFNHLWGWHNHPYRFLINLIFPLAVLTAMAIRWAPRPVHFALGAVMIALIGTQIAYLASTDRTYGNFNIASKDDAAFLHRLERITAKGQEDLDRLLNPPEFDYPKGALQNGYLLSYSHIRGIVPDYRYVLSQERYRNRVSLFCFLFPGYPAIDKHTQWKACGEMKPPPSAIELTEARLKTALLGAYNVNMAAAFGPPFSDALRIAQRDYGWRPLAESEDGRILVEVRRDRLPGVADISAVDYSEDGATVTVTVSEAGEHSIIVAGRNLAMNARDVLVDESPIGSPLVANESWRRYAAQLATGVHRLRLPWSSEALAKRSRINADYLYFVGVINAANAKDYLGDASGSADDPAGQQL